MKKILAFLLLGAAFVNAEPLSSGDRNRVLSHLHATRKLLVDNISGLSAAQWNFKSAPGRWSIAECVAHITIAEGFLLQTVTEKALEAPATPEKNTAANREKDARILAMLVDRSQKFQAPESMQPAGKTKPVDDAMAAFKTTRDRTITFLRETDADLRSHFASAPGFGDLDAYQWVLFLSAHSERHIKQIEEIKADPAFPGE